MQIYSKHIFNIDLNAVELCTLIDIVDRFVERLGLKLNFKKSRNLLRYNLHTMKLFHFKYRIR